MYRRILLPLDGSSLAERALPHAVAQARHFEAELILLRVLEPLSEALGKTSPVIEIAEARTREMAQAYLERVAVRAREKGLAVRVDIVEGRAHHQIVEYAQRNQVDLIVICARGHSGISRWLMGSVADRVMRGAEVPVLLVRAVKSSPS